jgi:oligopeptidase B
MATPSSVIDFNMKTKEKSGLKRATSSWGKFDKNNYIEERFGLLRKMVQKFRSLWFTEKIWKRMVKTVATLRIRSYGHSGCLFSSTRLSLLDRGFIYAIAHIRGEKI